MYPKFYEEDIHMFRAVFWVVLPCQSIVDRRFRGAYCLHHQGWVSRATEGSRLYRCRVTRWSVVVGDDRLGTGQWQWAGGGRRREREVYRQRMWSGCNLALERASLKISFIIESSGGLLLTRPWTLWSHKRWEIFDQLSDYYFLKTKAASWFSLTL
jgi:hypothetical protein